MNFATILALLVGVLVAAPLVAHLLRRRKTELRAFPPARLVLAAQPVARQRARLEDRGLFSVRALAILALAILGATPFVSCSRLSLGRKGGGSVAVVLVIDDSMSMQARQGDSTRFQLAIEGARQVVGGLREGDAVAVIAAGSPPRLLLAATSDLGSASNALGTLRATDRSTDLDGALGLAASIARALPHIDRRVVLLSDLADGSGHMEPPGINLGLALWTPLPELHTRVPDCAVVRASRKGNQVVATVACGDDGDARGRTLRVVAGQQELASSPLDARRDQQITLTLPDQTPALLQARLTGDDAIPGDDAAPVTAMAAALQVAVVSDLTESALVTGGPSPVEQALSAIDETLAVRPLPVVPDDAETLASYAVVVLDDPPGLTPEARAAFKTWMQRGGVGMLWLGPRAGGAILGAAFDPFVTGPVRWLDTAPPGASPASVAALGETGAGLLSLAPRGRARIDERSLTGATITASWLDGAPLIFTRPESLGSATVITLPAATDISDLPLRPAFLELLAHALDAGRARQIGKRSTVGQPWAFRESAPDEVQGPTGPIALRDLGGSRAIVPERAGLYALRFGQQTETRVVEIDEREVDTRPRPTAAPGPEGSLGSQKATLDASPYVAFVLLLAIAAEAALRLLARRDDPAPQTPAS